MAVEKTRKRYIAFKIEGGKTDRRGMIGAIKRSFDKEEYNRIKPWLTVFTGKKGIVKINYEGKQEPLGILNSMKVGGGEVKTITTSGTIKKAKKRLFEDE